MSNNKNNKTKQSQQQDDCATCRFVEQEIQDSPDDKDVLSFLAQIVAMRYAVALAQARIECIVPSDFGKIRYKSSNMDQPCEECRNFVIANRGYDPQSFNLIDPIKSEREQAQRSCGQSLSDNEKLLAEKIEKLEKLSNEIQYASEDRESKLVAANEATDASEEADEVYEKIKLSIKKIKKAEGTVPSKLKKALEDAAEEADELQEDYEKAKKASKKAKKLLESLKAKKSELKAEAALIKQSMAAAEALADEVAKDVNVDCIFQCDADFFKTYPSLAIPCYTCIQHEEDPDIITAAIVAERYHYNAVLLKKKAKEVQSPAKQFYVPRGCEKCRNIIIDKMEYDPIDYNFNHKTHSAIIAQSFESQELSPAAICAQDTNTDITVARAAAEFGVEDCRYCQVSNTRRKASEGMNLARFKNYLARQKAYDNENYVWSEGSILYKKSAPCAKCLKSITIKLGVSPRDYEAVDNLDYDSSNEDRKHKKLLQRKLDLKPRGRYSQCGKCAFKVTKDSSDDDKKRLLLSYLIEREKQKVTQAWKVEKYDYVMLKPGCTSCRDNITDVFGFDPEAVDVDMNKIYSAFGNMIEALDAKNASKNNRASCDICVGCPDIKGNNLQDLLLEDNIMAMKALKQQVATRAKALKKSKGAILTHSVDCQGCYDIIITYFKDRFTTCNPHFLVKDGFVSGDVQASAQEENDIVIKDATPCKMKSALKGGRRSSSDLNESISEKLNTTAESLEVHDEKDKVCSTSIAEASAHVDTRANAAPKTKYKIPIVFADSEDDEIEAQTQIEKKNTDTKRAATKKNQVTRSLLITNTRRPPCLNFASDEEVNLEKSQ